MTRATPATGVTSAPAAADPARALPAPQIGATPQANPAQRSPMPAGYAMPAPAPMPMPAAVDLKAEAIDRIAPLNPKEIEELRLELKRRGEAATAPLEPPGKPVRRVVKLDLAPGAAPEVVRTAFAQGSVITFVDAAGRPWPVVAADNFNPQGFDVATFGASGVSIGVKTSAARAGNLGIQLEGLPTPVMLAVQAGQREVDYSVEFQVARMLPGVPAPVAAAEQMQSLGAVDLLDYLLNTPPKRAKALVSDNSTVQAWQVSPERMIVRTDGLVASPAWQRRQSSSMGGVSVYDVPLSPVLLVAIQGDLRQVRVSGFSGTKEQKQ